MPRGEPREGRLPATSPCYTGLHIPPRPSRDTVGTARHLGYPRRTMTPSGEATRPPSLGPPRYTELDNSG
jgi:hypothetical protein